MSPCRPKDLRPISIFSTWYRLLTGATMAQDSIREWIMQVVPSQAHGGVQGRWVATALSEVIDKLDAGAPALALDFAKCFDHVDPRLVISHLRLHKWPEALVTLLEQTWLCQKRYLQLGKCTLETPAQVSTSLPQGDPVSVLGLLLVLGDAIQNISATGVSQSTFLDDRVMVADSVKQLMQAQRQWTSWSARLGLVENREKILAFAQNQFQRMAFLKVGISDQIRILGIDVFASSADAVGNTQQLRLNQGQAEAIRLARAPVSVKVKEDLYRTRIVPKLSWGWWLNVIPVSVENKIFSHFRKVAEVHHMASKHLRLLLNGHVFSTSFMACQQSMGALRAAALSGLQWSEGQGAWPRRVNKVLQEWDWEQTAPWIWHHPQEGELNLLSENTAETWHRLRESWRRFCWRNFCCQDRRDSRLLMNVQFSSARCKEAQRLFASATQHGRAVMTGAALSLGCYQVIYEQVATPGCSLCGSPSAFPSWEHLVWKCPAFATGRPPEPSDQVQQRLAWPPSADDMEYNEAVLQHMAAARAKVWSYAPSSRGRRRPLA